MPPRPCPPPFGAGWGPTIAKIVGEILENRPPGLQHWFNNCQLFWTLFFAILEGTDGFSSPFLGVQNGAKTIPNSKQNLQNQNSKQFLPPRAWLGLQNQQGVGFYIVFLFSAPRPVMSLGVRMLAGERKY